MNRPKLPGDEAERPITSIYFKDLLAWTDFCRGRGLAEHSELFGGRELKIRAVAFTDPGATRS